MYCSRLTSNNKDLLTYLLTYVVMMISHHSLLVVLVCLFYWQIYIVGWWKYKRWNASAFYL